MFDRIFIIVLDSVGIGELPDADKYGDAGSNTLGNIAAGVGLRLPQLAALGLGRIAALKGVVAVDKPLASYGKMTEVSSGKDTTSGHWEIAGCPLTQAFPVYPKGFPASVVEAFERETGCGMLGNVVASGTQIIEELGKEHMETGKPIVYTSADSVFQIAAHEEIIPLERLYEICRITREKVCVGEHAVGRVIARPFVGAPGAFKRTPNRHDFSLEPPAETMLDALKAAGLSALGVGKIGDIYAGRGLTESTPTKSNRHGMELAAAYAQKTDWRGLCMVNLVEFDSSYGHRNDAQGYAAALEEFDGLLASFLPLLSKRDLLIITADHGCDPTTPSTDHSREYVPLLVYAKGRAGEALGTRATFSDVAATVADNFGLSYRCGGASFLPH